MDFYFTIEGKESDALNPNISMDGITKLAQQIQQLETAYAELLADGTCATELTKIWEQIKDLKKQVVSAESKKD